MRNAEREEGMGGWGRFKINHIVFVWMILTFGIILLLIITTRQYTEADNQQGELTKKILRCHKYADQIQDAADTMTNSIWRFVATEDTGYAEAFLAETTESQSRDRAIEMLKQENITDQEREEIEKAQELSDKLRDQELYHMHLFYQAMEEDIPETVEAMELTEEDLQLTAEEMKRKASEFLFGREYLEAKEDISVRVATFGSNLTTRLESEIEEATVVTAKAKTLLNIALWVLLGWAIVFWALFRQCLVIPMKKCFVELNEEDREAALELRGPCELRRLIDAFNRSITRLKDKNQEIYNIKMYDPITGGFTSGRFELEMEGYLREKQSFAFVAMDIKRFKVINELYGEETGNRVLKKVYQIIFEQLKSGEFIARNRADIFNIVLLETSQGAVKQRVVRIKDAIKEAFQDEEWNEYRVSMSCGVYMIQNGDHDVTSVRGRANVARKKYKNEEGLLSPCIFYSEEEAKRLINDQRIENQMERALSQEEFQIFLQPKVRLADEKVAGAEALVRWKMADGRMISPKEFIPLFEKNGFIVQLDYYMFRHVCALLRKWIDSGKELMPISVNLSRNHIKEKGFIQQFQKIQREYGVPSNLIEFEVTEEMVVENLEEFRDVVEDFHAAGYHCSMDDFGTGYSSLNVLREIPLDVLKMDRAFFTGKDSERGNLVIKAVLNMAQSLYMQTVAEGVETRELVDFLRKEGCDMVQGYVFYRPMPTEEFEKTILG